MQDRTHIPLVGRDGRLGWVNLDEQPENDQEAIVRLENGMAVRIPTELLVPQPDGTYTIPLSREQFRSVSQRANKDDPTVLVIPVIAEEIEITKQQVTKGRVQISKQVHERDEVIDVPILQEEVHVNRVPVDRMVDTPPEIRYEGNMMIIPVLEEVLVVEKRLRVKEEVQITRVQKEVHTPKQVTVREETVKVKRVKDS
jgi:uncharacterized protein (TIGR02271 family)